MTMQSQTTELKISPSAQPIVLVVDDEQCILELLENILQDAGYTVLTAHDGHIALTLARQARPDLVLTDMMMPHMDGAALCTQLRRDPAMSRIAILGMSAVPQAAARAGFTEFLAKPFEFEEVLRCVDEALAQA